MYLSSRKDGCRNLLLRCLCDSFWCYYYRNRYVCILHRKPIVSLSKNYCIIDGRNSSAWNRDLILPHIFSQNATNRISPPCHETYRHQILARSELICRRGDSFCVTTMTEVKFEILGPGTHRGVQSSCLQRFKNRAIDDITQTPTGDGFPSVTTNKTIILPLSSKEKLKLDLLKVSVKSHGTRLLS